MIKYLSTAARQKHHIIKTKCGAPVARRLFAKSTLLSHSFSRRKPPAHRSPGSNFFRYVQLCTSPGQAFSFPPPFHTFTRRWICSRRFSQSAPNSMTRGRCYSHSSLVSSALTRRPVLPPSIMSRKLQFPHVSYRELWSALIEYSWYPPLLASVIGLAV